VTNAAFSFRRLAASDLPMLHQWMARPHWIEWWGVPDPLDVFLTAYGTWIADTRKGQPYIAWFEGRAFGYIQSYVPMACGNGWWENETDPGVRGIDQSIADPGDLNRGLGTAMVRAFVQMLFDNPYVTRIQTDPDPRNARAIRCYEKAGFRPVGEVRTPDGPALLMVCDRPNRLSLPA